MTENEAQEESQGVSISQNDMMNLDTNRQIFEVKDASTIAALALAAQLGTDTLDLRKGRFDIRRLTNIDKVERVVISHFNQIPAEYGGDYARSFFMEFMNLSVSIGGLRAEQLILMQGAVTSQTKKTKEADTRNLFEKLVTKRNWKAKEKLEVE